MAEDLSKLILYLHNLLFPQIASKSSYLDIWPLRNL